MKNKMKYSQVTTSQFLKITEINLPFLDDLFLKFAMIIEQKSLDVSLDSEKDYDNNIYYYILSALLGGRSICSKIKVNDGEQRQLVDNIFKQSSTSSTVFRILWGLRSF